MPTRARIVLLVAAAVCGAFVALLGGGFSSAVEPESYTISTSVFWFFAGVIFTAPLWVPALVPKRYPVTLKVCRWVGAAALLFPTYMFGSIVVHNISRSMSGLGATPSALAQGAGLAVVCLACLLILLWPELSTRAKRAT